MGLNFLFYYNSLLILAIAIGRGGARNLLFDASEYGRLPLTLFSFEGRFANRRGNSLCRITYEAGLDQRSLDNLFLIDRRQFLLFSLFLFYLTYNHRFLLCLPSRRLGGLNL